MSCFSVYLLDVLGEGCPNEEKLGCEKKTKWRNETNESQNRIFISSMKNSYIGSSKNTFVI